MYFWFTEKMTLYYIIRRPYSYVNIDNYKHGSGFSKNPIFHSVELPKQPVYTHHE